MPSSVLVIVLAAANVMLPPVLSWMSTGRPDALSVLMAPL